jgi:hypothetical protein
MIESQGWFIYIFAGFQVSSLNSYSYIALAVSGSRETSEGRIVFASKGISLRTVNAGCMVLIGKYLLWFGDLLKLER